MMRSAEPLAHLRRVEPVTRAHEVVKALGYCDTGTAVLSTSAGATPDPSQSSQPVELALIVLS